MLHCNNFFLFSFFLSHSNFNSFFLSLFLFFILFLNNCDSSIEFCQQMGKLGVNFIHQIAEISTCFIIDSFEKHHRSEILFEVLYFVFRKLSLQNINNRFFLCRFYFFSQSDNLILESNDSINIPS